MKILLAEDDAVTRRLLAEGLRQDGHDVTAAMDGDAAWNAFIAAPAEVLVLDWQVPGLDGLALCRRIRETKAGQTAFVLMLTEPDSVEDVATAIDGADDYVVKPITREQLRFRVLIAERRLAADAARRDAEQQLEEARWTAGVSQAIVALQHEINNPLTALFSQLELAVDDLTPPEEYRAALEAALVQTRRIVAVMRRISAMREHRRVEYVPGVQMLDIPGE